MKDSLENLEEREVEFRNYAWRNCWRKSWRISCRNARRPSWRRNWSTTVGIFGASPEEIIGWLPEGILVDISEKSLNFRNSMHIYTKYSSERKETALRERDRGGKIRDKYFEKCWSNPWQYSTELHNERAPQALQISIFKMKLYINQTFHQLRVKWLINKFWRSELSRT